MIRRLLLQLTLALTGLATISVAAQALPVWPQRAVRIIVAAPAGSSVDIVARSIVDGADGLRVNRKQVVIVENRPAASGTTAAGEVARAAPDGYTLLLGFNGPLATPWELVLRNNRDIDEVLADPARRAKLFAAGIEAGGGSPAAFGKLLEQPDYLAFVSDVNGVSARHFRQTRHGHDVAAHQHHKLCARCEPHFANRQNVIARRAPQLRIG